MINPSRECVLALALLAPAALGAQQPAFTLDQVMSPPFPDELVAAPAGGAVAWVFNARGARNIWVAAPPDYRGKAVTSFAEDDGQELADLRWTPDGRAIVYVRGGAPNEKGEYPNPHSLVAGVEQAVWVVPVAGGNPRRIGEGRAPAVSPKGDRVALVRRGQIWWTSLADTGTAEQLIHARGSAHSLRWSPDGARLAFVSARGDHAFIGVFDVATKTLRFLDPTVDSDGEPTRSPDGRRIAFVRIPAGADGLPFTPQRVGQPWSIRVADGPTVAGRQGWAPGTGRGRRLRPHGPAGQGRRDARSSRRERVPAGVSGGRGGRPPAGAVPRRRRHDDPRTALPAARAQARGAPARRGLFPRGLAAPDAARLALLLLLPQCLRAESVLREPGLCRAVGELPQRHRLWDGVPRGAALRRPGGERVQRRAGSRTLPARPGGRGPQADRLVGWLVRRLPHRAGPGARLRSVRRGRGPARGARLEYRDPELGPDLRPRQAGGRGEARVRVLTNRVRERLALAGSADPRRRRPQRAVQPDGATRGGAACPGSGRRAADFP